MSVAFEPPGRKPTPTSNFAVLSTPTSDPVEPTNDAAAPAAKSAEASFAETPAHLSLYTESCVY